MKGGQGVLGEQGLFSQMGELRPHDGQEAFVLGDSVGYRLGPHGAWSKVGSRTHVSGFQPPRPCVRELEALWERWK